MFQGQLIPQEGKIERILTNNHKIFVLKCNESRANLRTVQTCLGAPDTKPDEISSDIKESKASNDKETKVQERYWLRSTTWNVNLWPSIKLKTSDKEKKRFFKWPIEEAERETSSRLGNPKNPQKHLRTPNIRSSMALKSKLTIPQFLWVR